MSIVAPHNTVASLIKEVIGNLDWDTVAKACRRFQAEAVVEANGDFCNTVE
jgi:hypothetical protein